jgi:hypothetical protein
MKPPSHELVADRIAHGRRNNGNDGGRLLGGTGHRRPRRHDEVDLEMNQFGGQAWEPLGLAVRSPKLDGDVLPLHVAVFA